MKANSSGNRYSGTAPSHRSYEREQFVHHQQDLARRALHLGSPGAARAALRALYGVDFVDSQRAMELLRTLRDPSAPQDEVMEAVHALIQLEPVGEGRPRIGTHQIAAFDRDDVAGDRE